MGLSQTEIQELLAKVASPRSKVKSPTGGIFPPQPRPVQLGPFKYYEETMRCSHRGCGVSTMIRVNGAPKCGTHSLYDLNRIILEAQYGVAWLERCTCNTGRVSKQNCHTADCPLYEEIKYGISNSDQTELL